MSLKSNRLRLILVISSLRAGGAERVLATIAGEWVNKGHDVTILTTHDGGAASHYPLKPGVKLQSVDPRMKGPLKHVRIVRSLRRIVRKAEPDAVISFLNYTNILTLAACRGTNIPVVVSERLDPRVIDIGPLWSMLRRCTYPRAVRLVAQTPTAAELYEHLTPGRVRIIPNPVPPPPNSPMEPLEEMASERPTILAVGRLQYQKGYDVAIRAMKEISGRHPEWRLVILGEGPLRPDLKKLRDNLGIQDNVVFAGQVKDPWSWLQGAQIYLMSSRSEGFPNALCEAMAVGLPVISTDCPSGPADIITHEVDGLLTPSEDPEAMAKALDRLITSAELRNRLAQAAPDITQRYSLESVMAGWDGLLEEITPG